MKNIIYLILKKSKYPLIEENKEMPDEHWYRTSTKDVGNTQLS